MHSNVPCLPFEDTRVSLVDADETARFGALIGRALAAGDVLCLWGGLGAGKTALARAAIQARLGRAEDVPSPTFTLVQVYEADIMILHADLYRLSEPEETLELGLFDTDDAAQVIEWPERLAHLTPERRFDLTLSPAPGGGRLAECRMHGPGWSGMQAALEAFA